MFLTHPFSFMNKDVTLKIFFNFTADHETLLQAQIRYFILYLTVFKFLITLLKTFLVKEKILAYLELKLFLEDFLFLYYDFIKLLQKLILLLKYNFHSSIRLTCPTKLTSHWLYKNKLGFTCLEI